MYVLKSKTDDAQGEYEFMGQLKEIDSEQPCLDFGNDVRKVEVRIAVSALSTDVARKECARWNKYSFNRLKKDSYKEWKELLAAVDVKGGTDDDKAIFYTSLYRACLSPVDVTSADGRYLGTDGKVYRADGFRYYSNWSLWDTFRTKFPLLVLLKPGQMRDIATSLLHLYRTGKKDWATLNESTPTVRTEHAVILLLDAYRKGITDLDFNIGYAGMKEEMERLLMRKPDQKMEAACDLWAMAQISEIMGKKEDAILYKERAERLFEETWKKEFMNVDASYEIMKGNGLYQGTRWQYRWAAPHCFDQMIALVGKEKLAEQIDYFFKNDLFNQGNEPDIHTPLLYNIFGNPEGSQRIVRDLLTKEDMIHRYGGNAEYPTPFVGRAFQNKVDGFAPEMDEDDGTMSAWYIFCSMGFYPVVVGDNTYEMVSPLYDKIKIRSGANTVTIRTAGRKSADDLIRSIEIDGKPMEGYTLSHDVFLKSSKITIRY